MRIDIIMKLSKKVIKTLSPPIIVPIISYYIMYSDKLWGNPKKDVNNIQSNKRVN